MLQHTILPGSLSAGPAGAGPSTGAVLFCHGILGSRGNFRTLANHFLQMRPTLTAVLVDLRRHGQSLDEPGPDTVDACADDLVTLSKALPLPVVGAVGHSFGGKVVLAYAEKPEAQTLLRDLFILDSNPGPRPLRNGSESTLDVLRALEKMPKIVLSREAFVEAIRADGLSEMLARWLAMNLVSNQEGGYTFRLDLAAIRRLLDDYFARDLWAIVENPPPQLHIRFVNGGRSTVFDPQDRERLERAAIDHPAQIDIITFADAGHWIHVDEPKGTLAAIVRS